MPARKGLPVRLGKAQVQDDLIMGTNSSSIVSKRSVERLYYPDEAHFFRYFVKKPLRRSPLINRGYWLRMRAIDVIVQNFINCHQGVQTLVVNLGCGSDVLPWQCLTRYGDKCRNVLFMDVDYPDLMRRKRDILLETPQLKEILGDDFEVDEADDAAILVRSNQYAQIACDLRQLDRLHAALTSFANLSECRILFVAEVSMTYMDTSPADALIEWAAKLGQSEFCLLEQIIPYGPSHPFAKTMLGHFNKLNAPPKSVHRYPNTKAQRQRFLGRGWNHVEVWDLWDAWSSARFLTPELRTSLDDIEPFDEWEEFMLFARHYFVLHATVATSYGPSTQRDETITDKTVTESPRLEWRSVTQAPKRRFGNAFALTDVEGRSYAVQTGGLDANGRADSQDLFMFAQGSPGVNLPSYGPSPRMCGSCTDLGNYGVLVAGGRGSPTDPSSSCWLFSRGAKLLWCRAPDLPTPLYRHAAVRLRGTSMALVAGGKTGPSQISPDLFVFHPIKGWLRCEVNGTAPAPVFGGFLSSSVDARENDDLHYGVYAGGIGKDGTLDEAVYTWQLDMSQTQPRIRFNHSRILPHHKNQLCVFGAAVIDLGHCMALCGGISCVAAPLGQVVSFVSMSKGQVQVHSASGSAEEHQTWPFMIGASAVHIGENIVTFGGGATCFSMGTYWDTAVHILKIPSELLDARSPTAGVTDVEASVHLAGSRKVISQVPPENSVMNSALSGPEVTPISRLSVATGQITFSDILQNRKPVVLEGLILGACLQTWTPQYIVDKIGGDTQVVVHECTGDEDTMDFNNKNFRYVTMSFDDFMRRAEKGERLYLRSLSKNDPTGSSANIESDFPSLAEEFQIPTELSEVRQRLFSSILRVSGRANMWLHYDVMANIYSQIIGTKEMILFPPHNVTRLHIAPGASSSSLNVFSSLKSAELAGTHPCQATLNPGDVLYIPPAWLHTARPTTDLGVAVNVFFRDLQEGYSEGRDVYGNRDLAPYERGRQDASRIIKSFQSLPSELGRFYLSRIADEIRQIAES